MDIMNYTESNNKNEFNNDSNTIFLLTIKPNNNEIYIY